VWGPRRDERHRASCPEHTVAVVLKQPSLLSAAADLAKFGIVLLKHVEAKVCARSGRGKRERESREQRDEAC
jgi:hypothetical protein